MREDILTALRNALDRGENLEQAKYTLVMAGYPRQEIEEAANFVYAKEEKGIVVPEGIARKKPSAEKIRVSPASGANITPAERLLLKSNKDVKKESQKISEKIPRKKDKKTLVLIIIASFLSLVTLLLIIFRNKILEALLG